MRAFRVVLAVVGGCAVVLTIVVDVASGHSTHAGWVLVVPLPFYAVGLFAYLRRPDHPAVGWMLAAGASSVVGFANDALLPAAADWTAAWVLMLLGQWVTYTGVVAAVGFIGLFPAGRAERPHERWVLGVAVVLAALLPVLNGLSSPQFAKNPFADPPAPSVGSPFFMAELAPLGTVPTWLYYTFPLWFVAGPVLLALRYRRSRADQRRRIRWLLAGPAAAFVVWTPILVLPGEGSVALAVVVTILWLLGLLFFVGSSLLALFYDGVFGIDRPMHRAWVYRVLWALIALGYVTAAAGLGVLAGRQLPIGVAVLLAIGATLLFQPVRRRLERLADRWVFGERLDGYELLSRFGTVLEKSPGPARLLPELAEAVRRGLNLTWARVCLDPPATADGQPLLTGTAGIGPEEEAEPAIVVPLVHGATVLGRIECGPRQAGALVDEDRRLLGYLSRQAAAAVYNLYLAAELSARLGVIRRQAAELAASRARIAQGRDAERRRIQRDLHDGVQQEVVALTAKLGLARQRLRRGDPRAEDALAELHQDLGTLLGDLREFAYAIHPPVLADQGLLEAVEAQAARLPVAMVVQADPALRGVRYPPNIEAATWYLLSEALTNVVKHASATQVVVSLRQPNHQLVIEVRDDGCGFDPAEPRGLGLAGLADRMDIVGGDLRVDSAAGKGTTLHARIPLAEPEVARA
jgi:signal transduction histidine kinase